MEKEIFTLEDAHRLDDLTVMQYAIPVIVLSVVVEWLVGIYKKRNYYHKTEFVSALTIGAVNAALGSLLKVWLFAASLYIYNLVPWAIPRSWWGFVVCFVALTSAATGRTALRTSSASGGPPT